MKIVGSRLPYHDTSEESNFPKLMNSDLPGGGGGRGGVLPPTSCSRHPGPGERGGANALDLGANVLVQNIWSSVLTWPRHLAPLLGGVALVGVGPLTGPPARVPFYFQLGEEGSNRIVRLEQRGIL